MKKTLYFLLFTIFILFLNSCVEIGVRQAVSPPTPLPPVPPPMRRNITHAVGPGETIWRISQIYDVPMRTIIQRNRLRDPNDLKKGQILLVPNAASPRPVISLYPSKKWKYIIIHHSATDEGCALAFDRYHTLRGFTRGLGYHFVIDNGTKGKFDGQIEISPRWLKHQNGAHCRAGRMNPRAIGICLVGNFNIERVSEKQMVSLLYLVNRLRKYYGIPLKNIMGHGQVPGARTDCPGTHFSWKEFKRRLKRGR